MKTGFVYLAGAGPGDPELVTLKTMRVLSKADCIVYDYLANAALLQNFTCEKIYVGKQGGNHTMPQEEINALIVSKAKEGKTVVRLKGGDPFIFGRGGEEAEELVAAGVPFAVVPGISSFYSAPCYAGIPVTHRDFANAFEVVTGHRRGEALEEEDINFPDYNANKTFLFLMGMKNLARIAGTLIKEKHFPPDTPAAVVCSGTMPAQRTVVSVLQDISSVAEEAGLTPPAIILVGRVASLRDKLRWFDTQPLFGKRIVVTRSRMQASVMAAKLSALGADVIEFPTIEIKRFEDMQPLHNALSRLDYYKWIVFTSQNAASIFFDELFASGKDIRSISRCKVAAIGRATSDSLKARGILCDCVPDKFVAESLLEKLTPLVNAGDKILLPCSADSRIVLAKGLGDLGAAVDVIHIYESIPPVKADAALVDKVINADCVTFASSSTARNFFALVPDVKGCCASIGPVTSATLRELGHTPDIEADEFTIDGLIDKLISHFENK